MPRYCIAIPAIVNKKGELFFICITETKEECEEVRKMYNFTHPRTEPKEYFGKFPCFCRLIEYEEAIEFINLS